MPQLSTHFLSFRIFLKIFSCKSWITVLWLTCNLFVSSMLNRVKSFCTNASKSSNSSLAAIRSYFSKFLLLKPKPLATWTFSYHSLTISIRNNSGCFNSCFDKIKKAYNDEYVSYRFPSPYELKMWLCQWLIVCQFLCRLT